MSNFLSSLSKTIHASLALAIILFLGLFYQNDGFGFDRIFGVPQQDMCMFLLE